MPERATMYLVRLVKYVKIIKDNYNRKLKNK